GGRTRAARRGRPGTSREERGDYACGSSSRTFFVGHPVSVGLNGLSDAGDDPADGEEGEGREAAAVVVGDEEVGEGAGGEGDGDADEDGSDELGAEVLVFLLLQVERDVVEHLDDGERRDERQEIDDRA